MVAIDTETTGLYAQYGDKPFAIIIHDGKSSAYFNFNSEEKEHLSLSDLDLFDEFFSTSRVWVGHNIKFDCAMLRTIGIEIRGRYHDTMVIERLVDSVIQKGDFSLKSTAARYGYEKLDIVDGYIKHHNLTERYYDKIKGVDLDKPLYHKVPLDIMYQYGIRDVEITFGIYERQLERIIAQEIPDELYDNECALLAVVYGMERDGVRVDTDYANRGYDVEAVATANIVAKWYKDHGTMLMDSYKYLAEVFKEHKSRFQYGEVTAKGNRNPKFDSDWLESIGTPDALAIINYRRHRARADSFRDMFELPIDGLIHANFNQHIATTGRFSSSAPNLQNLANDDDSEYKVRSCIIPYHPGWWLSSIDYDQIEYRLAVDYAACPKLSAAIKSGLDVHQAMANLAGIDRVLAKAVNFAMIYGSGDSALAKSIGATIREVAALKAVIFGGSPALSAFLKKVRGLAESRGYIRLWSGRRIEYPILRDKWGHQSRAIHKAANGLCQGGAADIIKYAMVRCSRYLSDGGYKTKLLLTVHDELVFSGPPEEEGIIKDLVRIMSSVYPYQHVPITASAEISYTNLSEMKKCL